MRTAAAAEAEGLFRDPRFRLGCVVAYVAVVCYVVGKQHGRRDAYDACERERLERELWRIKHELEESRERKGDTLPKA